MGRHMKRVVSPVYWKAGRKNFKWVTSPRPGAHPLRRSIPLQVLLRDVLELVETGREARAAIHDGKVAVDGKIRKDHKFGVGLMDTVSIIPEDIHYRVVPYEKGLRVIEIPKKEAGTKLARVIRKQIVKDGKVQVTTHDGQNFLGLDASTGDTIIIKKKTEILPLEKGNLCLVTRGKQAGRMGNLIEPTKLTKLKGNRQEFEVPLDYIMVVGKKKPKVKLYDEAKD